MKIRFTKLFFLLFLCTPALADAQQDSSKAGSVILFQREGNTKGVSISKVITLSAVDCDSMSLNGVRYALRNVTKIVTRPCELNTSDVALSGMSYSENLELAIYPNPTNGKVRFVVSGARNEQVTIQVFNVLGTLVHQFTPLSSGEVQSEVTWDLTRTDEPLSEGMYFIRAVTPRAAVTHSLQFSK
jgi:hypothetical protein